MFIGFAAIIYFFTLIDDIEDLEEYWLQILFIFMMAGTLLFGMFRKKGKLHTYKIEIKNDYLKVNDVSIKMDTLILDVYVKSGQFIRYHLRDTLGKLAIYSIFEDDLSKYFLENFPNQTNALQEISNKNDGPNVSVISNKQTLNYDLGSGKYSIKTEKQTVVSFTPDVYAYDGKYRQGKPLLKKLKK